MSLLGDYEETVVDGHQVQRRIVPCERCCASTYEYRVSWMMRDSLSSNGVLCVDCGLDRVQPTAAHQLADLGLNGVDSTHR